MPIADGVSRVSIARRSSTMPLRGIRTPVASFGPARQRPRHLRQPVAVGGHHARRRAVRLEQHARQVLARLVQRHREDRLRDHVAQHRRIDVRRLRFLDRGQLRVVAVGHPDHLELDLAGLDLGPVLVGPADADLVVGQPLHDLVQLARRDGQAAFLLDLRRQRHHRRHVQVRRPAQQLVLALGADEDVGQDRERALPVGDTLREIQPAKELVFANLELHPGSPSYLPCLRCVMRLEASFPVRGLIQAPSSIFYLRDLKADVVGPVEMWRDASLRR